MSDARWWLAVVVVLPVVVIAASMLRLDVERLRRLAVGSAIVMLIATLVIALSPRSRDLSIQTSALSRIPGGEQVLRIDTLASYLLPFAAGLWLLTVAVTPRAALDRRGLRRTALATLITLASFLTESAVVLLLLSAASVWIFLAALVDPTHRYQRRVVAVYLGLSTLLFAVGVVLLVGPGVRNPTIETAAMWLIVIAALVRKGIVPFHAWVPEVFDHGRLGPAILFNAPQVGAYMTIVLIVPRASPEMLRTIAVLALVTAVYGAALALVQTSARRACGYLFMSQSALVMAGLDCSSTSALAGGLVVWLSAGLAFAGLARCVLVLEARRGRLDLTTYHGGYERMPLLAVSFLAMGLACTGFPGTLGFIGQELLVDGAVDAFPVMGFAIVIASALTGLAVLRMYFSLFCGRSDPPSHPSQRLGLRPREAWTFTALVIALVGLGVAPRALVDSQFAVSEDILRQRQERRLERRRDDHAAAQVPWPAGATENGRHRDLDRGVETAKARAARLRGSGMTIEDRTPILVGAGQSVHRDAAKDLERGTPPHPMDLAGEAARRAIEDAGASGDLAAAIDTIAVMRLFGDSSPRRAHEHGRASNPPRSVARRIGADPANAIYVEVGGNSPQKWVNLMAERIANGEAEVVLLAGAEAIATLKRAGRAGVKLDWNEEVEGTLEDRGFGPSLLNSYEIAHGITFPTQVYPLFEQAIRHRRKAKLDDHLESMGRLFAPFTDVAAGNPYAYFPKSRSPRELATPEGENPFIALPYGRLMNARDGVDQGAAVLLTSVGRARSLGIPPERWVFLHGCADASEPLMSEREDYTRCPAIRVMAERAFAMAGMGLDDVTAIDLYSCFPSAVEVACAELGLREDDPRGLTVTGGLPFFGGPGNNYSMHGIAEMVGRLRGKPDEVGLVTANGGYLSKHSMGLYSARPVEGEWRREDPAGYQAPLTARPKPEIAEEANGDATVVTYTVVFDDQAAPRLGIVVGQLADGRRFLANIPQSDRALLDSLAREDGVGARGRVEREGAVNVFKA